MTRHFALNSRGQALTEFLLALPLLLLFAGATLQFSLLFLARTQFEQACGEAGREYAAGSLSSESFPDVIWENLGRYQFLFGRESLSVQAANPSSPLGFLPSPFRQSIQGLSSLLQTAGAPGPSLDYTGKEWTVSLRYTATPVFTQGILFQTSFSVLRHPGGTP